jgi:hypothetical protein
MDLKNAIQVGSEAKKKGKKVDRFISTTSDWTPFIQPTGPHSSNRHHAWCNRCSREPNNFLTKLGIANVNNFRFPASIFGLFHGRNGCSLKQT